MKMVKSLLLGSAAGLVAVAGAQAADLPVKAKPVQYVKICSLYGVGFYYIPGTDMCIKVGGWARYETGYGYNGSFTTEWWNASVSNRFSNDNNWRVKGTATFDARSPTQYGTVRSYIAIGISNNNTGDNPTAANYANRWFIQWAGFTIGHSTSFYDFYSIGANQYGFAAAGSDSGDGGWDVFAYTMQFGNGFSGSISAEVQRKTGIINTTDSIAILNAANRYNTNYQGHDYPDLVANLRVDQAWGSAQIMGALHNVAASYYFPNCGSAPAGGCETSGHPDDRLGFAVGIGLTLKADVIAKGDYFSAEADYSQGASRYTDMTALVWDHARYEGNNFGWGYETDAVYGGTLAGGDASALELTTTWNVNAAYTHFWDPSWKSTLWGSYRETLYNSNANAMICAAGGDAGVGSVGVGTGAIAGPGCDMDWRMWGVGLRTEWAVSSTFQIGLEVLYANLESAQTTSGLVAATALTTYDPGKPPVAYTISDQDIWAVRLRINRNFYP